MSKGYDNDCRTAKMDQEGTRGRADLGQYGGEQQRRTQKELDGGAGARHPLQWPTELVGDRVSRPYAPLDVKYSTAQNHVLDCTWTSHYHVVKLTHGYV